MSSRLDLEPRRGRKASDLRISRNVHFISIDGVLIPTSEECRTGVFVEQIGTTHVATLRIHRLDGRLERTPRPYSAASGVAGRTGRRANIARVATRHERPAAKKAGK